MRHRQQSSGVGFMGRFHDIMWKMKSNGGRRREIWSLRAFRQFVIDIGAVDIGYSGYPFTWVNRRFGDGMIKEHLDRVLVSPEWRLKFDRAQVRHLFAVGSDHAAMLLDTNPPKFSGPRQFRFDSRWVDDSESYDIVRRGWQSVKRGSKMFEVFQKVKNCRNELRCWSKRKNFNARWKITETQQKLKAIGEDQVNGGPDQVRALEKELGAAWEQEEMFWRQKARVTWMVKGDRNTSFFMLKSHKEGKEI